MRSSLKKSAYIIVFLLAAGYACFTLRTGVPALAQKRQQIQQQEKRNAELTREIELKRDRVNRLRLSPAQQELEIRQRLKLVRPEEKVYILQK